VGIFQLCKLKGKIPKQGGYQRCTTAIMSTSRDHQEGEAAPVDTQPVQASVFRQLLDLRGALGFVLNHPVETLRLAGAAVHQTGLQLTGADFRPERDIVSQTGKVILVTGGRFRFFLHLLVWAIDLGSCDRE
jgi:hypothetical protein